jgi:indole-3-glycerol phosphate synthase
MSGDPGMSGDGSRRGTEGAGAARPAPTTPGAGSAAGPRTRAAAGSSGTYLDRIVPAVRRRLEERKQRTPQAELEAMTALGAVPPSGAALLDATLLHAAPAGAPAAGAASSPTAAPTPARPSFAAALNAPGVSLIAEVKRASPSKGPLRPDLEVKTIVEAYEASGARAISVLTEEDHFQGSLADLWEAAEHTRLPLLRKDFIIDPYQIHEARAYGASAVLLIAALLDDTELRLLGGLTHSLGMDVLLEVHDAAEMARALRVDGAIIGVNNRDLRTFAVSLDTTLRLADSVPPERLLVGESGIRDHADVAWLAACGVDAVLVGESILRAEDIGAAVRALVHPSLRVAGRPAGRALGREAR